MTAGATLDDRTGVKIEIIKHLRRAKCRAIDIHIRLRLVNIVVTRYLLFFNFYVAGFQDFRTRLLIIYLTQGRADDVFRSRR